MNQHHRAKPGRQTDNGKESDSSDQETHAPEGELALQPCECRPAELMRRHEHECAHGEAERTNSPLEAGDAQPNGGLSRTTTLHLLMIGTCSARLNAWPSGAAPELPGGDA